jgi:hypothetical protein
LKYAEGFTRLWPSVATVLAMAASMYLLAGRHGPPNRDGLRRLDGHWCRRNGARWDVPAKRITGLGTDGLHWVDRSGCCRPQGVCNRRWRASRS